MNLSLCLDFVERIFTNFTQPDFAEKLMKSYAKVVVSLTNADHTEPLQEKCNISMTPCSKDKKKVSMDC